MHRKLMPTASALIALYLLGSAPLQAMNRGRAQGHQKQVAAHRQANPHPAGVFINLEERWRERDRRGVVVVFPRIDLDGRDGRPPGWDRGRKLGWGDCDVPPGLAKKVGCYNRFFDRRVILTPRNRRNRGVVISIPFVGYFRLQ